ncbi:Crp/Fnr family transcriptional regulator [Niabella sp. CC-SYL272]|uniref:Crp/Fnr family transcriptional regulator n=1 Tax=Niabella agricola TaxID=2891571 RepID=UPI001F2243E7|nr:Crp/Fnr family transcriptional regulator [Niabella agricola]MCF3108471.1 Crp/Fnr family transcriptional regulator [Niabella agricola]
MDYDLILGNITRHTPLNKKETNLFLSVLEYSEVRKRTCLLKAGRPCNVIYYVHSGALRAFYIDKNGKESTVMFATADWWITDMYCFLNRKPAMTCIEATGDSCVFQLSKDDLDRLFEEAPKFERFFRILMQNAYTREQLRIIDNLSLSAEEKYDKFLTKYPQIVKQVTQKQIASYLGITPEFLSYIRKNKVLRSIS